jgi:hypothetical protein
MTAETLSQIRILQAQAKPRQMIEHENIKQLTE